MYMLTFKRSYFVENHTIVALLLFCLLFKLRVKVYSVLESWALEIYEARIHNVIILFNVKVVLLIYYLWNKDC